MNLPARPWCEKYIGIPFLDGGREMAGGKGLDCWGLVRAVLQQECNIETPTYGELSAYDLLGIAGVIGRTAADEPWIDVHPSSKRAFDIVVMTRRGKPRHLGVLFSPSQVLHTEELHSSVLISLDHPSIAPRISSFLRHRDNL